MRLFLNGTAMRGGCDHGAIAGARFIAAAATAPKYRFYSVRDEFPGLVPDDGSGAGIVGELYEIDDATWRDSLLPAEPVELVPGVVELDDGSSARAMILDLAAVAEGACRDITAFGGWRSYLSETRTDAAPAVRTS